MVTTLATDQQTVSRASHEYTMPASGMLFANDHDVGRTFIFDVRNPLQPKIRYVFLPIWPATCTSSYLRLPNGHVLATSSTLTTARCLGISEGLAGWLKSTTR